VGLERHKDLFDLLDAANVGGLFLEKEIAYLLDLGPEGAKEILFIRRRAYKVSRVQRQWSKTRLF
jgi:hypothetical protein